MKRRTLIRTLAGSIPAFGFSRGLKAARLLDVGLNPPMATRFEPNWGSLQNYTVPEWFRDAKFGIWAHWGPQCQPEYGDWYARSMYMEGSRDYSYHLKKYGHPSVFGFKDVIHEWKAENWDPGHLVELYRRAGAKYFVALANHHDNFDNYNSKHQSWNSVAVGPKKDLIGGWAKAASHGYKTAASMIRRLADIVSKNGNLLLNVPVRGDGTIDSDELAIVEEIAAWTKLNGEAIFATRPWKICGEGPALNSAALLNKQGFNEGSGKPFTGEDVRFTTNKNILYAISLGAPTAGKLIIKSLGTGSPHYPGKIGMVAVCGSDQRLSFTREENGLVIELPESMHGVDAYAVKILPA